MGKKSLNDSAMEVDGNGVNEETGEKKLSYKEQCLFVNAIAKPLASRKLAKKIYQLISVANTEKGNICHGLGDVKTNIRKGARGLVIIAGDVTPIDVYSFLPCYLEELKIDYIFTPSREDLGSAMGVKRSVLTILIKEKEAYKSLFDDVVEKIKDVHRNTIYPSESRVH